jgi:para-nitrobenzyl esterase
MFRGATRFVILGLAALAAACVHGPVVSSGPEVATASGRIAGVATESGVHAYLGIPYAAPPVRELRWREPQPVAPWTGVRHANGFGPQCTQPQRGVMTNQYSGAEVTSEDCLYLNVWAKPGVREAPVIVFLHGGGFFIGAGSMPLYGGEQVAQHDAVFVNLNYRVGPLGFLAHPELSAESPHGTSGNYGLLDQVAALRWVRDNIAQFGGDPANVTIAGQSAGSMSVLALQASPLAQGLFHRAVGMSGALIGSAGPAAMRPLAVAERDGLRLQEIWQARDLAQMRAMPADRLVVPRVPGSPPVGPIEDGHVLPGSIEQVFDRAAHADVPLIVGFTRDESLGGLGPVNGLADFRSNARAAFGDRANAFLRLYPASTDEEARQQARIADRDQTVAAAMDSWARAHVKNGTAPVYSYLFARPHSYAPGAAITDIDQQAAGAYHTSEVPFWLGTLESFNRFRPTRAWTQNDRDFSAAMTASLVVFAHSGSPTTAALDWPRFDPASPVLLELGSQARPAPWPDRDKLEFFRATSMDRPSGGAVRD